MCRVYEFPHCTLKPWCIFLIRKPENIFVIFHSTECSHFIPAGLRIEKMHHLRKNFCMLFEVLEDFEV